MEDSDFRFEVSAEMLELLEFENAQRQLSGFLVFLCKRGFESFDFVHLNREAMLVFEGHLFDFADCEETRAELRVFLV